MKTVSVNKAAIQGGKWTPKWAYIFKKLENSSEAAEFSNFILEGPTNGVDSRKFVSDGRAYIRVSDMRRFFISYSDTKKVAINKIPQKAALKKGDILISRKGTPGIAVITTKNDLESVIGTEAILIRVKKEYDPYYLVAFLNSKIFFEQVLNNLSGTVAFGINHPSLKKLKILYDEAIASDISRKVKKAVNLQVKSADLISKAQALFYQKLGIDFSKIQKEENYSVKLSGFVGDDLWTPAFSFPLYVNTLKAIQKKWQTVSLGAVATVLKGDEVGSKNYTKFLDRKDSDIPLIRTSDIVNHGADLLPDFYIPTEIYDELGQDIEEGDILFTKDGKIGMSAIVTEIDKIIISSGIARLRVKDEAKKYNLTPEYLFTVLSLKETGMYPAIRRTVVASTIPHLRSERLEAFEIPVLAKESIDEITELVKNAFALKNARKKLTVQVSKGIEAHYGVST